MPAPSESRSVVQTPPWVLWEWKNYEETPSTNYTCKYYTCIIRSWLGYGTLLTAWALSFTVLVQVKILSQWIYSFRSIYLRSIKIILNSYSSYIMLKSRRVKLYMEQPRSEDQIFRIPEILHNINIKFLVWIDDWKDK